MYISTGEHHEELNIMSGNVSNKKDQGHYQYTASLRELHIQENLTIYS